MKTKLTLSIDRRKVAMLRKASARKGSSISELVENMADDLDLERDENSGSNIEQYFGTLKLKPEDFEEEGRAGAELRKTEYYERIKKAKPKKA